MEKSGGSRLLQMQARYQQKQMQEREMKIASLYEAQQARALDRVRHSPGAAKAAHSPPQQTATPVPLSHQPGKVRQMFEERRTKAGIDKSYPLQPIHNTERPKKPLPNGQGKVTSNSKVHTERKTTKTQTTHTVKKQQNKIENIVNGSGDLNHNHESDLNKNKMPVTNGVPITRLPLEALDRVDGNLIEDETFPDALAPAPTPRSPVLEPRKPPRRSPTTKTSPAKAKPQVTPVAPPRRATSENAVPKRQTATASPTRGAKTRVTSSSGAHPASPAARPASAEGSGAACTICGRRFAPDRLPKHEDICRKAHAKKRKPFDALKHRLAGTEAEPFISKLRKAGAGAPKPQPKKLANSNWRQKHNEFIQAIRAAKQVQAHLSAGGKLSDLPPPPPSENPDYVQCPHCSRRFNQAAAERHIPKCSSFQHNKPKPVPKRR